MDDEKGKDYDPQRPVYTFPVLFRWGPVVMENLVTEEERRALALEAFHQLAKRQTDFIVRFQFFDHREKRYTLAAYGNEDLCIHCDVNEYFEETIHRDLLDASNEPAH